LITPLELEFISASDPTQAVEKIVTFTSYQFERNITSPVSAFRFTAPGVNRATRLAIRSGDMVQIFAYNKDGDRLPIAIGIIDETDSHIGKDSVEYVVTGRDILGQLADNASVDANNKVIFFEKASLTNIIGSVLNGTRCPQGFTLSNAPNGQFLFSSNVGETKINALQRMLEFANLLIWSDENGQVIVGKPDFAQATSGDLILLASNNPSNNILECRVRRNLNQAIRKIATQLQSLGKTDPGTITMTNSDDDMVAVSKIGVGRSVYQFFDYGGAGDSVNTINQVGNQSGNYNNIGYEHSRRLLARENMKILEVEAVVKGHINSFGEIYDIDQTYNVQVEDEDVSETMYTHSVSYELTKDQGMLTRLHLCKLNTIVSGAKAI